MDRNEFTEKLKELVTDGKTTVELYNEISAYAMIYGLANATKPAERNA